MKPTKTFTVDEAMDYARQKFRKAKTVTPELKALQALAQAAKDNQEAAKEAEVLRAQLEALRTEVKKHFLIDLSTFLRLTRESISG